MVAVPGGASPVVSRGRPRIVSRGRPRVHPRRPRRLPRRGHPFTARRRRRIPPVMPHPVLGRLLPVGRLGGVAEYWRRHLHRLVSRYSRREEVWLPRGGGEGRHVRSLSRGCVWSVDVSRAGRMGWGMEGRRVGGGRVVHSRGHSAVWRAHGRCPLYGGAAWRRLSEVLLEPFE